MIFLTVGTHQPFDRLVQAMDAWCAASGQGPRVMGQITDPLPGAYVPRHFEWVGRLDPAAHDRHMAEAELIVSHAGMGSILTALRHARPIVVMPRRADLHEMRNDHQLATVRMLRDRPGLHVAADETDLPGVIDRALAAQGGAAPIADVADPAFTAALRDFLTGRS